MKSMTRSLARLCAGRTVQAAGAPGAGMGWAASRLPWACRSEIHADGDVLVAALHRQQRGVLAERFSADTVASPGSSC